MATTQETMEKFKKAAVKLIDTYIAHETIDIKALSMVESAVGELNRGLMSASRRNPSNG